MLLKNDGILVKDFSGRCQGRLNFSILVSWLASEEIGSEFTLPFDYFYKFELNSEFNYQDTCAPMSIYRFRLICLSDEGAILRIENIFKDEDDMWLYENLITYGVDYGIIEFVGVYKKPDLKLLVNNEDNF